MSCLLVQKVFAFTMKIKGKEKEWVQHLFIFIMKLVLLKVQLSVIFDKKGTYYWKAVKCQ